MLALTLPENLRREILQRSAGNPFYLEEILRMLIDQGVIRRELGQLQLVPGVDLTSLGVPETLRKTLFSTNPIESAFSVVEEKCGRVKKWQGGDMKLRWVASGLLFVEEQFRKVKGYRDIPQLIAALNREAKLAPVATARRVG